VQKYKNHGCRITYALMRAPSKWHRTSNVRLPRSAL
jgi:hypothetical protein